jgi:hypothetical protein
MMGKDLWVLLEREILYPKHSPKREPGESEMLEINPTTKRGRIQILLKLISSKDRG